MNGNREEWLAAYLDGALSPEDEQSFEAEIARDPELARLALQWQENDRFIVATLAERARPVEPELMARMGLADGAAPGAPRAANDNILSWRRVAAAAAVVLTVGVSVLMLRPSDGGNVVDPVSLALDRTPSMTPVKLADGRTLTPVLTVQARDGRWCREYTVAGKGAEEGALACRDGAHWKVEATGAAMADGSGSQIVSAAGAGAPALDEAYGRIGAGEPLDATAEAAVLRSGWQ